MYVKNDFHAAGLQAVAAGTRRHNIS